MRRAELIFCAGVSASRFKVLKQREQLPFSLSSEDDAADSGWGEYSLRDALELRLVQELTLSGLKPEDASNFVFNGIDRVERGRTEWWDGRRIEMQSPRGLFEVWDDEIWIAREIWTCDGIEDITGGRNLSVTWWGGTEDEIKSAMGFAKMGFDRRETLGVFYYNLTRARQKVLTAAREINLPELADFDTATDEG